MISDEVKMLLERMKTNPEEFVNVDWNPIGHSAWSFEPFEDVRWGNLLKATMQTGKEYLFTEEELEVLQNAYAEVLRVRCKECIVKELVSNDQQEKAAFRSKQMKLPYATTGTNTARTIKEIAGLADQAFDDEYKRYRKVNL